MSSKYQEVESKFFKTCESTQEEAWKLLKSETAEHRGHLYWARASVQTKGRGRRKREWISQENQSLLCSVAFEVPEELFPHLPLFSLLAGHTLYSVVFPYIDKTAHSLSLKWPNDLVSITNEKDSYVFKKLAGILCEAKGPVCVIGWGLNFFSSPTETVEHTLSLNDLIPENPVTIEEVYLQLRTSFNQSLNLFVDNPSLYKQQLIKNLNTVSMKNLWGKKITYNKEPVGTAIELGTNGELVVQKNSDSLEKILLSSGEIDIS